MLRDTPIAFATSCVVLVASPACVWSTIKLIRSMQGERNQNPHLEYAQQENILNLPIWRLEVVVHLPMITIRRALLHDRESSAHLVPISRFDASSASCRVISVTHSPVRNPRNSSHASL